MKILSLVHGLPPENPGGTESSALASAEAMAAAGHPVTLVAGSLASAGEVAKAEGRFGSSVARVPALLREEPRSASEPSLRILRLHRGDLYFDHGHKTRDAGARRALARLFEDERPDVLHVHHWMRSTSDVVALAHGLGIPAVVSLHDAYTACPALLRLRLPEGTPCEVPVDVDPCLACTAHLGPATPFMDRDRRIAALERRQGDLGRELRLARALLVPSASHGEALVRWFGAGFNGGPRFEVLSPRVDRLPWRPGPSLPPPGEHGALVLACFGTLSREKGLDRVLRAMAELRGDPELPELRLEVAGAEPDREFAREVRGLAEGLSVRFHGEYRPEELAEHAVAHSHAFVSGTRAHESFGLVLDEARALGLPHLLPAQGAFLERGGEGRGGMLFGGDRPSLSSCLRRLLGEADLLERLRGETRDVHRESVEVGRRLHVERLEAIYRRVIDSAPDSGGEPVSFDDTADFEWTRRWDAALAGGATTWDGGPSESKSSSGVDAP